MILGKVCPHVVARRFATVLKLTEQGYDPVKIRADCRRGERVFGGLVGCMLLLARKWPALPVFAVSLIGYLILYFGDITEGVFAAIGTSQVGILSMVVAIAAALMWLARHFDRRDALS